MVIEDRSLQLRGYRVFRFGGHEFTNRQQAESMLTEFFDALLAQG